ncbi:MAG: hypothetical protein A2651_01415 [Candidatus Yanofskybacteria bacterium RIFCSPHIGHO2_01_FULL_42_12]|nr:MAG: hypothetical protein A2651_01415 [Candidatus Yanofskybacteria bacterium RIFCSPHIGHO2_01_FULL_42_12]
MLCVLLNYVFVKSDDFLYIIGAMICKNYNGLKLIREQHKDEKIVFCSGSFDLTHAGHVLFFEDCKKYGDILVVGVGNDYILKVNKGKNRPILNQHIRLKLIDSIKPVDYCFLDESKKDNHPLDIIEETFKKLKPDAYIINQDAFDIPYRKNLARKYGVTIIVLERFCPPKFANISTSKIIEKIRSAK